MHSKLDRHVEQTIGIHTIEIMQGSGNYFKCTG